MAHKQTQKCLNSDSQEFTEHADIEVYLLEGSVYNSQPLFIDRAQFK